jgi:protein MpaA
VLKHTLHGFLTVALIIGCTSSGRDAPVTASPPARPAVTRSVIRLGESVKGRPIEMVVFTPPARPGRHPVLVMGGIHGNEHTSVHLARRLIEHLDGDASAAGDVMVAILPDANPDATAAGRRTNANGVDVNRNFPAKNWRRFKHPLFDNGPAPASEPETRAILKAIETLDPERIISIHSIDGRNNHCNNYDGPGEWLARLMSQSNGYPVKATMGYPTPGSLGSWAGVDRRITIVTLELPRAQPGEAAWLANRAALLSALTASSPQPLTHAAP